MFVYCYQKGEFIIFTTHVSTPLDSIELCKFNGENPVYLTFQRIQRMFPEHLCYFDGVGIRSRTPLSPRQVHKNKCIIQEEFPEISTTTHHILYRNSLELQQYIDMIVYQR